MLEEGCLRRGSKEQDVTRAPLIGIDLAHHTLRAATSFLSTGIGRPGTSTVEGPYRAKVIGNGLRELDRFLNILLDEIASTAGWSAPDLAGLRRQRNTANKLQRVCDRIAPSREDLTRLRSLARCRDCLFYCNGVVRRSDRRYGSTMTAGWPAEQNERGAGRTIALGEPLVVALSDLRWICAFYERLAADLVADFRVEDMENSPPELSFIA